MSSFLFLVIDLATKLLSFSILILVILSWFPIRKNVFLTFLTDITAPFFLVAKRLPHRFGVFDLSPIWALLLVDLLRFILLMLYSMVFPLSEIGL